MKVVLPLFTVLALAVFAWAGVALAGQEYVFGIVIPYAAFFFFLLGFAYRVISWARSPVPFNITTTAGQQKSLPWIKADNLENPYNRRGLMGRMLLEILLFRSLFRNTRARLEDDGRLTYGSSKWLWFIGLLFHWTMLVIVVRHLRLFSEPVPALISALDAFDSILQVGAPAVYLTNFLVLAALFLLLLRRLVVPQLRYVSLINDYFPLFLIMAIMLSGMSMRYVFRVDIMAVKEVAIGLATFHPHLPANIGTAFFVHLFLVSTLLFYFPASKLMHMGGVFLSPTRNMYGNARERRHVNPWNPEVKFRTYAEYEDEFRAKMKEVGIPVEKE